MAKINTPVDGMFRAGQISSKEWKRLSMKQPGKGAKTHGRMANFDAKTKDEAGARENKAAAHTKRRHIDGPDQGMAGRGAVTAPTRGGGVHGGGGNITRGDIDAPSRQKPDFPRQGSGAKPGQSYRGQQPASANPSPKGKSYYGGPSRREERAERTRGAKLGGM